ncbi:MAG: metal-dependent hydrolase [Alphaproteobacteria bacterium]|nr:metal-dependent hydrolase [Alphaproteobacteria bacterium]
MKITWLGHAAYRVEIDGAVILIDPFISGSPVYEGTLEEASAGCTHVVLSHGHDDHVGDTADICKSTGAMLVANFELCMWLQGKGVENINPGNHGGTLDCGPFRVTLTDANHSSSTLDGNTPIYLGNPNGLVFEGGGMPTLYHMGDTNMFSDMALIEEFHQPEVGIVPIGDRFTMGARQAAISCKRYFNFKTILPCHFGTFPIIDPDASKFLAEMGDDAGNVKVLDVGGSTEV